MEHSEREPKVGIGLPVYNGERYLERALDTLLWQDFTDFEILISDNASTDRTEEICRKYAAMDSRIRYVRQDVNQGQVPNLNYVFWNSRGKYYVLAAHDDEHAPTFLSRCVEILDNDPTVVTAFCTTVDIDEDGNRMTVWKEDLQGESFEPHVRFGSYVRRDHECFQFFGINRREVVARTPVVGAFASCDVVLLAELSLHGRLVNAPDELFWHREHPERLMRTAAAIRDREKLMDSARAKKVTFTIWRIGLELVRAVNRAPLTTRQRLRCYAELRRWLGTNWVRLIRSAGRGSLELGKRQLARLRRSAS